MSAKLKLRNQEYEVRPGIGLREALLKLEINPETVLAVRDGTTLTDDEILQDGDFVRLVAVISGGAQ
jgi:sulfur carrier protein